MEERKKNLCAMIPESLHKKVREEQEEWRINFYFFGTLHLLGISVLDSIRIL